MYTASLLFYNTLLNNASSEFSNAKCAPVTGIALGAQRKGDAVPWKGKIINPCLPAAGDYA